MTRLPRRLWPRLLLFAASICYCATAMPAKIDHIDVAHEGKRYTVTMRARMDVDAARAYAVFTDFPRLVEINSAIIKAERIEGAAPGQQRVHTQVRVCVMRVCRIFDQVQDMQLQPPEQLSAQVIPELSNLRFGQAHWRIWDQDNEAHLHFTAEIEPDFWIPPVVGPWLIKRKLQSEAEETANGIEQLALALAPQPAPASPPAELAGAL